MKKRRSREGADVELTPLIDVLFILIIFFVLTASFVQGQIPVTLPDGRGNTPERSSVSITIKSTGELYWDDSPIEKSSLLERATDAIKARKSLVLIADKSVPYGDVATLLDELRQGGVTSIGLALKGNRP